VFARYQDAELGYAVTDHTAQGRTVHTGLAVITGNEDRQHAYVGLTRGTDTNIAFVFTVSPKRADPVPGPRPAPELARYDRVAIARSGEGIPAPATTADALAVLASALERDGQQLSATQIRDQALADADHLAVLHAIWTTETTPARNDGYRDLYLSALPAGYRQEPSHQAKWLWRTLRAAELAGLDPAEALAAAIGERDLSGARDVASVIYARLRRRVAALTPRPAGSWSAQLPEITDPERHAFTARIAALMDERKDRIGEHAVTSAVGWAVSALGPVPDTEEERREWQRRAASIGAYRELSGHGPMTRSAPSPSPDPRTCDQPGTRPSLPSGRSRGRTFGACRTGRCCTCAAPTRSRPLGRPRGPAMSCARRAPERGMPAWLPSAPPPRATLPPGKAAATRPPGNATWPPSYQAMHEAYQQREAVFAVGMADRADWEEATRQQRELAIAADTELRRRHPGEQYAPLRSAESHPDTRDEREVPALSVEDDLRRTGQLMEQLAAQRRDLTHHLAERNGLLLLAKGPDHADPGPAFPELTGQVRQDAILQPPKPQIEPSPRVLERAASHDLDLEAAD
jgi:hypothetical protein